MTQDRLPPADPPVVDTSPSPYDQRSGHAAYGAWPDQPYAPRSATPGYGARAQPPAYGRAPGFGPPAGVPGPPARLNSIAVLALCMAFLAPPAGIVFGVIGRNQVRRTGEGGAGLALSAILVGTGILLVVAVYGIAVLNFVASAVPG